MHKTSVDNKKNLETAKSFFCKDYCDEEFGVHVHDQTDYEFYKGVEIFNIEKVFNRRSKEWIRKFPCEHCDCFSTTVKEHKQHYEANHKGKEVNFDCKIDKCDYVVICQEVLVNHYDRVHPKEVEETIRALNTTRSPSDEEPQT